jgi:hypothetical protein
LQFDKQQILALIDDPSQAEAAAEQLPAQIDHEEHSNLLQQFGVDPQQLVANFAGAGTAPQPQDQQ